MTNLDSTHTQRSTRRHIHYTQAHVYTQAHKHADTSMHTQECRHTHTHRRGWVGAPGQAWHRASLRLWNGRDITLPTKVHIVKAMVLIAMWELDYRESWALKNWCFWTVVLEKTLESPLDSREIKPVHPNEDQSWIFIGRTDAKAETPIL